MPIVVERRDHHLGEPVAKWEGKPRLDGGHDDKPVVARTLVVSHVYSARVRVSHHEVDAFGRAYPAALLRHLAATAVDASTAAGFDARWYAQHGVHWLVRRTTFTQHRPTVAEAALEVRTWVEDFRRVRSQRRYAMQDAEDRVVLDAVTDWVLVESASGKLKRISDEMERGFGVVPPADGAVRTPFVLPPMPATAVRTPYRVRYTDLDGLLHVNNAMYVDVLFDAAVTALAGVGWGVDALMAAGAVPWCDQGDVEYLDMARFGDALEVRTWWSPLPTHVGVHQSLVRTTDDRELVRFTGRWAWCDPASRTFVGTPSGLGAAVAVAA
jgi:acyl-CoA thioesterase FadM